MSVFTNPASGAAEDAEAYVRAVLELLGDRDPRSVLAGTAAALERVSTELSPEALGRPEAEGKWSIRQVLRHLADSELVWGWRLRRTLAEERPVLTGYDQDAWARRLGYADWPARESVEEFRVLRRAHLRLLEGASADTLARVAVHRERGEEPVELMVRLYAGHDLLHLRQIQRIRAVVEG